MSEEREYIWGMDLGLKTTAVTIYDLTKEEFVYIGSTTTEKITLTKKAGNKHLYLNAIKLKHISEWVSGLRAIYPPKEIAIERGFSHHNTSTQVTFRVHGVVNLMNHDKPQTYYPPTKVKEAILFGSATKEDVENAIKVKYNHIFSNEDESDSFAVCLTHLIKKHGFKWDKPKWSEIKKLRKPKEPKKKK